MLDPPDVIRRLGRVRRPGRARDERGAIAVISAIVGVLLLVVAAFSVDIGNAWAVRGRLQVQADDAALYAAKGLPLQTATSNVGSTKLEIAKRVAYQFVCHPVRGQVAHDPSMPTSCPAGPTSSSLDVFAQKLLNTNMVKFPGPIPTAVGDATTAVEVTTPVADVDFGFGNVVGASGTNEQKTARAKIYSPGTAAPIALSLQCILTAGGTAPLAGNALTNVVPLNYITLGNLQADSTADLPMSETINRMPLGTATASLTGLSTREQYQGTATTIATTSFMVPATTVIPLGASFVLHFYRARTSGTSTVLDDFSAPALSATALLGGGTALTVQVPSQVVSTVGTWYTQAVITTATGTLITSRTTAVSYVVKVPVGLQNLVGCGGLVDSPRLDTYNSVVAGETMRRNIRDGLDHSLTAEKSLINLSPPATVNPTTVLSTLSTGLANCDNAAGTVLDDSADPSKNPIANCVTIATDGARQTEFTQGFLNDPAGSFTGRLSCAASATACSVRPGVPVPGLPGTYNNDQLEDFKNPGSALSSNLFFGLSTYLTDDLPVASPPSTALKSDIYKSSRFMWAAIASRANVGSTTAAGCTRCPIITFRPIFITQDVPSGLPRIDELFTNVSSVLGDTLTKALFPFLDPATSNDHGIVMSGTNLRALRFQTIEPTSLPVPPAGYNGPVSDYLGVGPKITRLIR